MKMLAVVNRCALWRSMVFFDCYQKSLLVKRMLFNDFIFKTLL